MEVRISVRGLVEFILRAGDIDNRRRSSSENAMAEGSRIHRMIQRRMGSEYTAEVPLSYRYKTEQYDIIVDAIFPIIVSTPFAFIISVATAMEALPEIGLSIASGIICVGISNNFVIGAIT